MDLTLILVMATFLMLLGTEGTIIFLSLTANKRILNLAAKLGPLFSVVESLTPEQMRIGAKKLADWFAKTEAAETGFENELHRRGL